MRRTLTAVGVWVVLCAVAAPAWAQGRGLNTITEEIIRLEDGVDTLNDTGIKSLFTQHRDGNAMHYIVGVEIYDHLEKVMDRFEDVANRISGIVIEQV